MKQTNYELSSATPILLAELNSWHQECLYSQILFLRNGGFDVYICCDVRKKDVILEFPDVDVEKCIFLDFKKLSSFLTLRKFIIRKGIKDVVLNTAQGNKAMKFSLLPYPSDINFYGIIHNSAKLGKSMAQKIICHRIKNFFFLAQYIQKKAALPENTRSTYFSPAFFPNNDCCTRHYHQNVFITIPGSLDFVRRDYGFLIKVAQLLKKSGNTQNIKFVLLGNSSTQKGIEFKNTLKELQIEEMFVLFEGFVSDSNFHKFINQSDYILPLIHPQLEFSETYISNRISGTFPLALGHQKTMLCHKMFAKVESFDYPSLFYENENDFLSILSRVANKAVVTQDALFEANKNRYLSLLK